jgi:formylglycine-generating enzyme required for sulfatase activity
MKFFCSILCFISWAGSLSAQEIFRDCPNCPEMVALPTGSFFMGRANGLENEKPPQKITLAKRIAISRYEVTFDEWEICVAAKACRGGLDDHGWGKGRQPVINMNFAEAEGYAKWLSQLTGKNYRLPSEAEWEYAARAKSKTAYWWGDEPGRGKANCRECGPPADGHRALPVGIYPPNPFGLFDMNGNIWEWTADCWQDNHNGASADGASRVSAGAACISRVIRGGSWYYYPRMSTGFARAANDHRFFSYNIGIRLVRELD